MSLIHSIMMRHFHNEYLWGGGDMGRGANICKDFAVVTACLTASEKCFIELKALLSRGHMYE